MKDKELIEEAHKLLFSDSEFGYEDTREGGLIYRLADALAALTTPQEWGARERVEKANQIANIVFDEVKRVWPDLHPLLDLRYGIAHRVIDEVCSRAAAPDATTELRAERDAAIEAIERVRAVLDEERAWLEHLVESGDAVPRTVVGIGKVEAALDGAPEPEWEYSVGFNDPECGWINDNADIHDNYEDARSDYSEPKWLVEDRVVRRRKAGPWLSVPSEEGENE